VWIVRVAKLFRFAFTGEMAHLGAAVAVSAPYHVLCLFLEGRSVALVAAVEPQVTARYGKVKQFQLQVTSVLRTAN